MGLNIASCLHNSATQFADQPTIVCDDRSYTFAELELWTAKIADSGLRRNDDFRG